MSNDWFKQEKTANGTSTQQLWGPMQSALTGIMDKSQSTFKHNTNAGILPRNAYTNEALNQTVDLARQPVAGLDNAQSFVNGLLTNGGMTGGMQQAAGYLTPFANGSMQEGPRLQAQLDLNANRAANATATRVGGGRYGSAAIGNAMGQAVTDANNGTILQANENSRNRQLQASGILGQLAQSGASNAMTAGSMVGGLNDLRYDGASRIAGVGDYIQNWNDQRRNYNWDQAQKYVGLLAPFVNANSTTVQSQSGQTKPSLAQNVATGAGILGKIWSML